MGDATAQLIARGIERKKEPNLFQKALYFFPVSSIIVVKTLETNGVKNMIDLLSIVAIAATPIILYKLYKYEKAAVRNIPLKPLY